MVGKYAREKLIRFDREEVISVFFLSCIGFEDC